MDLVCESKFFSDYTGYAVDYRGAVYSNRISGPSAKKGSWHEIFGVFEANQMRIVLREKGKPSLKLRKDMLVAAVLIPNPRQLQKLEHRDGDPQNLAVENLMWTGNTLNDLPGEEWKEFENISGYQEYPSYAISNMGRLRKHKNEWQPLL